MAPNLQFVSQQSQSIIWVFNPRPLGRVCDGRPVQIIKNLHCTCGIMAKRLPSDEIHFHCTALGQQNSAKTSQRLRAVYASVSDLTDPKIEPKTSRAYSDVFKY